MVKKLREVPQKEVPQKNKFSVGLICGGPSLERGISLNSARSVMDHLKSAGIHVCPFYVDAEKNFYQISPAQLYSNTPSDFDFKLKPGQKLVGQAVPTALKELDIVFPVIHGAFGEDGELQAFLEEHQIPFIGSGRKACQKMFHKYAAAQTLKEHGFETLPSALLRKGAQEENMHKIHAFFKEHNLTRAIVKPVAGGSSIGVFNVTTPQEACTHLDELFTMGVGEEAILEPFCKGTEFTVIVLQDDAGVPVALVPSEIQISYEKGKIFDYRRKYLPTANTKWPCPPHFADEIIIKIQQQAEAVFSHFGMADFTRLDGWLLEDGRILFTDLNPVSGLEQNSFIFQQAARVGFTHQTLLQHILQTACARQGIAPPAIKEQKITQKQPVYVLFGGTTAERQVSLMSGTNVWLKLRESEQFNPEPYFLDAAENAWHLPYAYTLSHTVEEVYENCVGAEDTRNRLQKLAKDIPARLGVERVQTLPSALPLPALLQKAQQEGAFIFLGLHGGIGEDGTLQEKLTQAGLCHNGSGAQAAALCMDKFLTGQEVAKLNKPGITAAHKKEVMPATFKGYTKADYNTFWQELCTGLGAQTFIIKPRADGCSAGIIHLHTAQDMQTYMHLVLTGAPYIEENTFPEQSSVIEMAEHVRQGFIIEPFIKTDEIYIKKQKLYHTPDTGWVELTVGVMECGQTYTALNPSITVAEGSVLSLEEKFQGGTGVNITPPPVEIITHEQCAKIKKDIAFLAKSLRVENYARLDIFFNRNTDETMLIEVNTLPGLTGSTVIYHQALAEEAPMPPAVFLEKLIINAQENFTKKTEKVVNLAL